MKFKLVTMDGKRKVVRMPDEAEEARAAVAMAIDEAAWKEEDGEEAKSNESEEQNQKPAAKSNDDEESEDESEEERRSILSRAWQVCSPKHGKTRKTSNKRWT